MSDSTLGTLGEFAELAAEYEFFGELGRGGSAVVYRARDRGLGRDVAIKVVHPRPLSADDDAVARLAREARTVAQLQHPSIVTVYAVRRLTSGGLALVMQLIPGRTLKAAVLQDGPMAVDQCERILRDVASALAYAHSRGIVHRDVKPENIFLDEETNRAMLSDFGIARSVEQDSSTLTGTAIGTPFYMSPEQIDGAAIDGRSDLYSLGLVAWELLTGRRPWDGESLYNVIYKQKHEELPPIEALRPGVPPRLQYIIERMLQKNPAARWAGADGVLSQLSHTVLPGDYSRWQSSLKKRVERYRTAERERVRAEAEPVTGPSGLLASTMRFVRGSEPRLGTKNGNGSAALQLSNTMVVPADGRVATLPPAAVALADPSNDVLETIAPTWVQRGRSSAERRGLARVGGAALVVVVVVALLGGRRLPMVEAWLARARTTINASAAVDEFPIGVPGAGTPTVPAAPPASGDAVAALLPGNAPHKVLSLGGRHSCVVDAAAAMLCWGANERGQLGDGTAARQLTPVRVTADLNFASVGVGAAHSCGVTKFGDIYCWGNDGRGQLGDATTVRRNAPVRVAGPGVYGSVAAGEAHTCAVTVEGAVHCWGSNDHGQLGDGSIRARTTPAIVDGLPPQRFLEVVVGASHSCARTDHGVVYCWGANERGQLGVSGGDRRTPILVPNSGTIAALSAGGSHTCGMTSGGAVRCWGGNTRGQLGTGNRVNSTSPQPVRLAAAATLIAAGGQHTCALLANGEAFCWGANSAGQVGSGSAADATVPVRVPTGEQLVALAAGSAHTCAVTTTGGLLCWGENTEGQLGDASRTARRLPVRVAIGGSPATRDSTPATR